MADLKITQLTELTSPIVSDILPIVDDPAGTPLTKKLTIANLISLIYPVGAIYTSVVSTSPATLFGVGTWSAFGAGRVLVGIDAGQSEFDVAEETGGANTHTLTAIEMPVHTHVQDSHTHVLTQLRDATTGSATTNIALTADTSSTLGTKITGTTTAINQNAGSGGAHNNLQPYIVVYMWKRTA